MKKNPPKAGLSKVDQVAIPLREQIAAGKIPHSARLPGYRDLAKAFGVSRKAVGNALRILEEEGLVKRRASSGVFVTFGSRSAPSDHEPVIEEAKPRDRQIAELIRREISTGTYKVGRPLPPRKELRYQFHASPTALKSALTKLIRQRLVCRRGNAFIVGPPDMKRPPLRNRVYLLPARSKSGGKVWSGPLPDDFRTIMGNELSEYGVSYSGWLSRARGEGEIGPLLKKGNALGFVCTVFPGWVERVAGNNISLFEKELARFDRLGLPVVFFNCASVFTAYPHLQVRKHRHIFLLGVDNIATGENAGRYLGMSGHKRIGFFSYSDEIWNEPRRIGAIRGIGQSAGPSGHVDAFEARIDKSSLGKSSQLDNAGKDKAIKEMISSWFPDIEFGEETSVREVLGKVNELAVMRHSRKILWPLFAKAFADKSITAWMGADPIVSVHAKRFLSEKGAPASHRISLISLDDNIALANQGITACSLSRDQMGYLAAHCLLGDIPVRKNRRGVVDCPPKIIERGTVGRV